MVLSAAPVLAGIDLPDSKGTIHDGEHIKTFAH